MSGCKKCPAFAKCTVTYRGSACAALRSTYGLDNDPEIPMTNADRIRAMSDEELKDWLCSNTECGSCKWEGWGGCELEDWLKQPAEEDA